MIYQLRHKETGQMYSGSYWTSDKAAGKCYNTIGKLRAAITRMMNNPAPPGSRRSDVTAYEVVEYDVASVKDIHEIVTPKRLMELLAK